MYINFKSLEDKEKLNSNLIGKPSYICIMCITLKHKDCFTLNDDKCYHICDYCFTYDLYTDGYSNSDYYFCEFCRCKMKVKKKSLLNYIIKHHENTEKHKKNIKLKSIKKKTIIKINKINKI